jgi:anti-sigma factor RsiW
MSTCDTHGQLLGGYVLGALEPAEMDEMTRHLAGCPDCAHEERSLAGLPALMDRIEVEAVPPPTPPPELEVAVLDRFVRERGRPRRRGRRLPRLLPVAAGAAALACAVVLALALTGEGDKSGDSPYATAQLSGRAGGAAGAADVKQVPAGTRVALRARGLATSGAVYELWCVRRDGRWVSGGTFQAAGNGTAEAELTAAVRPGDYHVMVVTRRAEDRRGSVVLRGRLEY